MCLSCIGRPCLTQRYFRRFFASARCQATLLPDSPLQSISFRGNEPVRVTPYNFVLAGKVRGNPLLLLLRLF